jgi:hypothetical protein
VLGSQAPWPTFSDDEVTQFLVIEAVALYHNERSRVEQERETVRRDAAELAKRRVRGEA